MSQTDRNHEETSTTTRPSPEAARIQQLARVALFNLFLAVLSMAVLLWITRAETGLARKIAEHRERRTEECASTRRITSPKPVLVDPEGKAPPQDEARNGYFGPKGAEIAAAMRLSLEAVRPGRNEPTQLLFGSQAALPSGTIHIVNLWATWCEPCREEMPDFRALFARRSDWGDSVRFVPIKVRDDNDPVRAYQEIASKMPATPVMLSDRSESDALTKTLMADERLQMFRGEVPVTLVLDCNRRVRWAQFTQLNRQSILELEGSIDRLRAELEDESPGAWCKQEWPGNGRCEGLENTITYHSLEDCGEIKRKVEAAETSSSEPPPPELTECPEGMVRTTDGECRRKLRGAPASTPAKNGALSTCGNNTCDAGENSESCCRDCGCPESRVCKPDGEGGFKCLRGLKGMGER